MWQTVWVSRLARKTMAINNNYREQGRVEMVGAFSRMILSTSSKLQSNSLIATSVMWCHQTLEDKQNLLSRTILEIHMLSLDREKHVFWRHRSFTQLLSINLPKSYRSPSSSSQRVSVRTGTIDYLISRDSKVKLTSIKSRLSLSKSANWLLYSLASTEQ